MATAVRMRLQTTLTVFALHDKTTCVYEGLALQHSAQPETASDRSSKHITGQQEGKRVPQTAKWVLCRDDHQYQLGAENKHNMLCCSGSRNTN